MAPQRPIEELGKYAGEVKALYDTTHSGGYQSALRALEELSDVVSRVRGALCHPLISWMGLCGAGERLAEATRSAALWMRELQRARKALLNA